MQAAPEFPSSVLVIDDEPVVLDLFRRVLAGKGLSIRTARNGEEALALIAQEGFGCVLADKNLPGIDGIEIVRRIRQTQPHCACIVMTAYASTESAVEALRLGAVDYIEKPFDDLGRIADRIDDLVKQMKGQFEGRARLRLVEGEATAPGAEDGEEGTPEDGTAIEVLQGRVKHATSDLRRRSLHLLSRLVASKLAGREVLLSGEQLRDEVRRLADSGAPDASELKRIEEQLEKHLALVRQAQNR
jgi:two-component system cell cycle sensor histidine kinase/response regulator CckA